MFRHRTVSECDMISNLPDEILCCILSYLPTKQAIATSLLSKRWRPLWQSVPTLDFDDQAFSDYTCFLNFVYALLLSRHTSFPVRTFRLKCTSSSSSSTSEITVWANAVVQRGVETLDLELPFTFPRGPCVKLPSTIFNCKTLTSLTLKKVKLDSLLPVDLPRLKTLHLTGVISDCCGSFMRLLYGCPVLEDLVAEGLIAPGQFGVEVNDKSLPNLVRAVFCSSCLPLTLFRTVESFRVIVSPLSFIEVPTFHNLIHLDFCMIRCHMAWKWLVEMLELSPKLQSLVLDKPKRSRICNYYSNIYEGFVWEDPQVVPECVSSQLRTCYLKHYGGHECELRFAEYIMRNSKILRTMKVRVLTGCACVGLEEMLDMSKKLSLCPRISPTCKLSFETVPGGDCNC